MQVLFRELIKKNKWSYLICLLGTDHREVGIFILWNKWWFRESYRVCWNVNSYCVVCFLILSRLPDT